jgi:LPS O-antigen subunit length determinant protein (WzzB/FepE family)
MKSNPIFSHFKLRPFLHLMFQKKWRIFIFSTLFTCLGIWIAYNIPNEYTSQVQILPELEIKEGTESMNNFKSLAGMAGVDLSSFGSTEAVRPDLYPNILQSTPFLMALLRLKVFSIQHHREIVLSEYLKECQKREFITKLLGESNKKKLPLLLSPAIIPEIIQLNKEEDLQIRELHKRVVTALDKRTGVITMSVKMQDPIIAATLARFTQEYLMKYVVQYRTEKTQKDINFLESRIDKAQQHYEKALFAYSHYQDMNRNLFLNIAKDQGKKLQHEVELAYNLYTQLATQLEETKIRIHRETPVFKVLEPAQVPIRKSSPSRAIIVFSFALLGFILIVMIITLSNAHFFK